MKFNLLKCFNYRAVIELCKFPNKAVSNNLKKLPIKKWLYLKLISKIFKPQITG